MWCINFIFTYLLDFYQLDFRSNLQSVSWADKRNEPLLYKYMLIHALKHFVYHVFYHMLHNLFY